MLSAEILLLAHAQVCLWSKVEASTGAVAVPKAHKALPLDCQLWVRFEIEITGEGVQSHLLNLVNVYTWAKPSSWPCGYVRNGHQKVVTLDINDTKNTMAVKRRRPL